LKPLTPSLHSTSFYPHKWEWELTTSLHFLIVSWFPRLNVEFRALAEKLTDDNVSDKFEILGHTFTIIKVFELPPANIKKHLQEKLDHVPEFNQKELIPNHDE